MQRIAAEGGGRRGFCDGWLLPSAGHKTLGAGGWWGLVGAVGCLWPGAGCRTSADAGVRALGLGGCLSEPVGSELFELGAADQHLDVAQRIVADFVGGVAEEDALVGGLEVLAREDVVGEEAQRGEPLVVGDVVLRPQSGADEAGEALLLLRGEEVAQRQFVAPFERIGVRRGVVEVVGAPR